MASKKFNFPSLFILLLLSLGLCSVKQACAQEVRYAVIAVAYSPNGNLVASGDEVGNIKLWNAKTGQVIQTVSKYELPAYNLAFSPDGETLAIAFINEIKLVNLDKNFAEHTIKHGIASIAFSPDGKTLASGNWGIWMSARDRSVCLWDVKTGKLRSILKGHHHSVTSVNYSPDGTQLVSADEGGVVKLWDAKTNALLLTQSNGRNYKRATAMFTTDGKLMATISENFYLSSVATTSETIENGTNIRIVPIRPVDTTIEIWDVRKATLLHTFDAHENGVRCIAFSPNGNFLATGGHLDAVKLWDIEDDKMIKKLEAPEQGAFALSFSPNSKELVGGFRATEQIKAWNIE